MAVTQRVGEYKKERDIPVLDSSRERQVLAAKTALTPDPAQKADVAALYESIMAISRRQQRKLVREGAVMPRRATAESAGLDLSAAIDAPVEIRQGKITPIPTGVAIQLDPGYVCLLFGRSGLGVKRGILPANAVGVVDSDYRGELMVHLTCIKDETYTVQPGERIAQMVILPVSMAEPVQVEELEESARGTGGFGSTGK